MVDSSAWTVDRLAANTLLTKLKLEATADMVDLAAQHFAEHRRNSIGWAAERAHSAIVRKLESPPPSHLDRENEHWMDGFRYAEQQILTTSPEDLLELAPEKARSKGQVLRALVRQARSG